MHPRDWQRRTRAAALILALSSISAPAQEYYVRSTMTDLDQIRQGLPLSGGDNPQPGGMYCVPTTSLNLIAYLKEEAGMWGIPVTTTNHDWTTQSIMAFGLLMGTSPTTGTSGPAINATIKSMIAADEETSAFMTYGSYHWDSPDWGVNKMKSVLRSGAIAKIGYGRYQLREPFGTVYKRTGGHVVTLAGFETAKNGAEFIYVADPATHEGNLTIQGPPTLQRKHIRNETHHIEGIGQVPRARYTNWVGDNFDQIALVDGMFTIMPISLGWFETYVDNAARSGSTLASNPDRNNKFKGDGSVRVSIPWHFDSAKGEGPKEFSFTPRENMVDWTFEVGELAAYYVTHLGRVFRVDLLTGDHKLLHVVKGAKSLTLAGPSADLYVHVDGFGFDSVVRIERSSNRTSTRLLPFEATEMTYDPVMNGPAFLSASHDKVLTFSDRLNRFVTKSIPDLPGTGEVLFDIDYNSGEVLLARKGAMEFVRVSYDPRVDLSSRTVPTMQPIDRFVPLENNLVAVQSGWTIQAYNPIGRMQASRQLTAVQARGPLEISRSHTFGNPSTEVAGPFDNWFPHPGLLQND